eukprot:Skav211370  [mRNA]  locus=scaffold595:25004:28193:- [translate_table: standard]
MLGLSFPFKTCSGDCGSSHRCFACHTIIEDEKQSALFARFSTRWRQWKARVLIWRCLAEERILAGLSAPFIRDLAGVRPFVLGIQGTNLVFRCLEKRCLKTDGLDCRLHDVLRICERIAQFSDVSVPFHCTQLTPHEFFAYLQTAWLERFEQHHAARRLSSSRRRAERFALMTSLDNVEDLEDDSAPPLIEGDDVDDDLRLHEELENLERAQWPVGGETLHQAMFREQEWMRVLGNRKASVLQENLQRLREFVNGLGGVPNARIDCGIASKGITGVERNWTAAEAQETFLAQKRYLEICAGGRRVEDDDDMPSDCVLQPLQEAEDPFLVELNNKNLGPADYASALVVKHSLNRQQILAIAPIAWVMQRMWSNRTDPESCIADGSCEEVCNCLWLGAGGSGKTYAYSKVLRPLFQRFFGKAGYIVGAPTHAAVRLLGSEAKTLHKWANVHKGSLLDRRSLRSAKNKGDPIQLKIEQAMAMLLDEVSMVPPDVYHAGSFRFSLVRQERLMLDQAAYLRQWFGKMPIGVQLADFLQLRPTAQRSLCEWKESRRAIDATAPVEVDEAENEEQDGLVEEEVDRTSNNAELGRIAFKSSLQRIVHFTGSGRFSKCESGQQLVKILLSMRQGKIMDDDLWAALEARLVTREELMQDEVLRERVLKAHWGGLAWEQVCRLQHLRVVWEAQQKATTLFLVQAIDRPKGPTEWTQEYSLAALQVANMGRTQYLMGICPLYEGMPARISCILDVPMLSRELPVIVRSIKLHPKEPAFAPAAGSVVLRYQPLAVLVEIDDPEYYNIQLPNDGAPKGHVWLRPVTSDQGWELSMPGIQTMQVLRKQIPLAPRCVLTHYGLQGITARQGLVAFFSKPGWLNNADYALAIYVMLSRPTKLDDLWIVDLPPRAVFETFLHEHNPVLVKRMREFEEQARLDEENALQYLRRLSWHHVDEVSQHLTSHELANLFA